MESEPEEERDGMEWLLDDEMRQWREVSKDHVEKRSEGGKLQVETVRSAPTLAAAQTQMKKMEANK